MTTLDHINIKFVQKSGVASLFPSLVKTLVIPPDYKVTQCL